MAPGMEIGRDFASRMCFLPGYPPNLLVYALKNCLSLCERNHLIHAYEEECFELLVLMKEYCGDKLHVHTPHDRVDLYNEWDILLRRCVDWLKKALGNELVNLNDANLVGANELTRSSLALANKTALLGRISKREWEMKVNKLFAAIDAGRCHLPVECVNMIREANFDQPQPTDEFGPVEDKDNPLLQGLKRLQHQLKNGQPPGPPADTKTKQLKRRFNIIDDQQVLFDKKDIGVPAGRCIKIVSLLINSMPELVKNSILNKASGEEPSNEAQDQLRSRKAVINKKLSKHNVPCYVKNIRGSGYVMEEGKPPTRKKTGK